MQKLSLDFKLPGGDQKSRVLSLEWFEDANCSDPKIFYPDEYTEEAVSVAQEFCQNCSVAYECLALAIINREKQGIWGGVGPNDRKKIIKYLLNFIQT